MAGVRDKRPDASARAAGAGLCAHVLLRGTLVQRLRLASGLILFLFCLTHFLNHALGLVDIDAMLAMQSWRTAATRSLPGSLLLLAALLTHVGLALARLAGRATLKLPQWEAVQIATGLLVPVLLIQHVVHNRGATLIAGTDHGYRTELANLWPGFAVAQTALLVLVWVHACIGLHFWLRLAPWWRRLQPLALGLAVAIPLLALAGFSVAGRQVAEALAAPGAWDRLMAESAAPSAEQAARLDAIMTSLQAGFVMLAGLAVAGPYLRILAAQLKQRIAVVYQPGPRVRAEPGPTVLEISRAHGIPHLSVCGGRGRCTTCRVRILQTDGDLPPPSPSEAAALRAIASGADIRLACQLRPGADVTIERLLMPAQARTRLTAAPLAETGTERTLAILFFDLRGFTKLSDRKLPYDVVFLLNRVFTAASDAIRARGGRIDKYMGDGLMAVFGQDTAEDEACRQAVRAARDLDLAMERLGREIEGETGGPLACAMGLHVGPMVMGRIGCPQTAMPTVIGRAVNAASRLESLAKESNCQLAVSRQVLRRAGVPLDGLSMRKVDIRGLAAPLHVALVGSARQVVVP